MVKQKQKSKYAKVREAKARSSSTFIRSGHYLARIDGVREDEAFKKGPYVAVEQTVVADLEGPAGYDYGRKVPLPPHKVGEQVTDIMMLSNVAFEQRIKSFAMAAGDLSEEDFQNEDYPGATIEELVGEDQPVVGSVVEFRASDRVKRDARDKAEEDLKSDDVYTQVDYIRRVPFSELRELVDETTLGRMFPDLDEQIQEEAEAEA